MKISKLLRSKAGSSIVEVVIAIVLIAVIAVFVAVFMNYWYTVSEQGNNLVEEVYSVQGTLEKDYSTLYNYIQTGNTTALSRYSQTTINNVFNKRGLNITIYTITATSDASSPISVTLTRGVADTYRGDPAIPVIDSVEVKENGTSELNVIYFPQSTDYLSAKVILSSSTNFEKNLLQWYATAATAGNFHALKLINEPYVDMEKISADCPYDFTFLSGKTALKLENLAAYKGRIIALLATPGSTEGYMGDTVASDFIYVSALPELNTGIYYSLIDPSLYTAQTYTTGSSDVVAIQKYLIDELPSEYMMITGKKLTSQAPTSQASSSYLSSTKHLLLNVADNNVSSDPLPQVNTRYLTFLNGNTATLSVSMSNRTKFRIFAVARSKTTTSTNPGGTFISYNGGTAALSIDAYAGPVTPWKLYTSSELTYSTTSSKAIMVGNTSTSFYADIAEIVVVSNPSATDITAVQEYLTAKYGLS